jgi:hypothetical protein
MGIVVGIVENEFKSLRNPGLIHQNEKQPNILGNAYICNCYYHRDPSPRSSTLRLDTRHK